MKLKGWEIRIEEPTDRLRAADALKNSAPPLLVLNTCQRLECYGFHQPAIPHLSLEDGWNHEQAFERLSRIAAGIESRIIGELEVLGQVRAAYKAFHQVRPGDLTRLDRIFQDAIALARKARRESGIDQNLTSLSGIAARELLTRITPGKPVAVIGSGSLAGSTARYLSKRGKSSIRVMSRCPDNALRLALKVGGFSSGLDEIKPMMEGIAGIICATAAPHPVLYAHHLDDTATPLTVIDLGEPPDCDPSVLTMENVDYTELREIESRADMNTDERRRGREIASQIIREGALAWSRKN